MKSKTTEVTIPAIDIQRITLKVVGDSPLITHKWSEKAKKEMLDKQMKKAKAGREVKDPVEDYIASLYWLSNEPQDRTESGVTEAIEAGARFGFPSVAFKAAAVSAGYRSGITKDRVSTLAAFHIDGEYITIDGIPEMREDMVRVGMGTADIRYRGMFREWSALVTVKYNANAISAEQVTNLFNLGGFACGVGEWRPEKDGAFGMFHVG